MPSSRGDWNERLQRWEPEKLLDLMASVPFAFEQEVVLTHARKVRRATLRFGWLHVRPPEGQQILWVLVVRDPADQHDLILLTNVTLTSAEIVRQAYAAWRQRGQIEHTYRFDQEDGFDVEDLRVQPLERMRRVFLLVSLTAQFVAAIARTWPTASLRWLRQLGGKLGLYVLLCGISAVWQTAALSYVADHPFPRAF
jgi:hypothetical protein